MMLTIFKCNLTDDDRFMKGRKSDQEYFKRLLERIIFIYVAENYIGNLKKIIDEGILEWIDIKELDKINQFEQNKNLYDIYLKNNYLKANLN